MIKTQNINMVGVGHDGQMNEYLGAQLVRTNFNSLSQDGSSNQSIANIISGCLSQQTNNISLGGAKMIALVRQYLNLQQHPHNLHFQNELNHYQGHDYVFPIIMHNQPTNVKLPLMNFNDPLQGYVSDDPNLKPFNDSQSTPSDEVTNSTPLCGQLPIINKPASDHNFESEEGIGQLIRHDQPQKKLKFKPKKPNYKRTLIENCPHKDRKHYAKKMCYICYIKKGRTKKAWKCKHPERVLYAKGMCKSCYLKFNIESRKKAQEEADLEISSPMSSENEALGFRRVNKQIRKSYY